MSDAEAPDTNPDSAEAKFVQLERELVQETSVIALMKDQMTSMFGMVFMFVITILLALYIRPWYDVAELHAFGEAGATQVRFIFLELVMIFIFTAVVIALARYKKRMGHKIRYNGCAYNRLDVYHSAIDAHARHRF